MRLVTVIWVFVVSCLLFYLCCFGFCRYDLEFAGLLVGC